MIFGVCVGVFRRLIRGLREGIAGYVLVRHYSPQVAKLFLARVPASRISPYKVSVIIPVNNGLKDHIDQLIDSIYNQNHKNIEIIAVDSGSTDGTPTYLLRRGVKVFHIPSAEFSHDRSRNLGAAEASGDYLLFTVADCIFSDPQWIEVGLRHLQAFGASSFCSPQRCGPRADSYARYLSYNHMAGNRTRDGIQSFGFTALSGVGRLAYMLATPALRQRCIHVDDTNHLVRRDVFLRLQFRTHTCEDMAFGHDLIRYGHRFILTTMTSVTHFHVYDDPGRYFSRIIADYQVIFRLTRLPTFLRNMNSSVDSLVIAFAAVIRQVLAACDDLHGMAPIEARSAGRKVIGRIVTQPADLEFLESTESRPGKADEIQAFLASLGDPIGQTLDRADSLVFALCARRMKSHLTSAFEVLAKQMDTTQLSPDEFRSFVKFCALNLFANNLAMALSRHCGPPSPRLAMYKNMAWR